MQDLQEKTSDELTLPEAVETPEPGPARAPRIWVHLLLVLGATLTTAVVCDALFAVSLRVEGSLPVTLGPGLISLGILWLFVLTLYAVVGRIRPVVVGCVSASTGFAVLNAMRMHFLDIPLSFRDVEFLKDPAFLVEMVGVRAVVAAVVGLVVLALALTFLVRRAGRHRPGIDRSHPRWRWWLGFRLAVLAAFVSLLTVVWDFNGPGNPVRLAYKDLGGTWRSWSQADNYRANGFVAGLLYNLPVEAMTQPEGYSRARMAQVAARWEAEAARLNAGTDPAALAGTNVVIVLSETMGDPQLVDSVEFDRDVIPHVRGLMESDGGHVAATFYGSGTSAMEFQVLTGQAMGLFRGQIHAPYQQFVTNHPSYPSLVGWLRGLGHDAIAVHPFRSHMYRRPQVYETFGFQDFLPIERLTHRSRVTTGRGFVSDRAAYREVLDHLRQHEDPTLVHLVTMQNHLPYADDLYPDGVEVTGTDDASAVTMGQWARGLEHSDSATAAFLRALERTGERTLVLQFGDHFPAIFDHDTVESEGLNLFRTPFFVWDSEGGEQVGPQGTVSPSALLPVALRKLGAPLPPYFALLARVQEEVGTLRRDGVFITPEGEEVPMDELTASQEDLLEDLRLVQYDFSIGERYALVEMWYEPEE